MKQTPSKTGIVEGGHQDLRHNKGTLPESLPPWPGICVGSFAAFTFWRMGASDPYFKGLPDTEHMPKEL